MTIAGLPQSGTLDKNKEFLILQNAKRAKIHRENREKVVKRLDRTFVP